MAKTVMQTLLCMTACMVAQSSRTESKKYTGFFVQHRDDSQPWNRLHVKKKKKVYVCLRVRCYLGLTPDDVVWVKVHSSMWRDRMMTFSAHVRQDTVTC